MQSVFNPARFLRFHKKKQNAKRKPAEPAHSSDQNSTELFVCFLLLLLLSMKNETLNIYSS